MMNEAANSSPPIPIDTIIDTNTTEQDEGIDVRSALDHQPSLPISAATSSTLDKAIDPASDQAVGGTVRTLNGDLAGDEFASDAINYQILLGKIDDLLLKLRLDA